jgi:hypothetical protein
MSDVNKQKQIALEVLQKLELFDPTCILAGGAPRDWYFGDVANDLDFYVYFRPDLHIWFRENQLEKVGLKNFKVKGKSDFDFPENYKHNPHLIAVYEGTYKKEKVQIMFMDEKTFTCVVPLFPFGICQAWWKGREVNVTQDFEKSVEHKVLWLLNELYSDEDGYIEKIRNKFPDYLYIGK